MTEYILILITIICLLQAFIFMQQIINKKVHNKLDDTLRQANLDIITKIENLSAIEKQLNIMQNTLFQQLQASYLSQQTQLENLHSQMMQMTTLNEAKIESFRKTLESQIQKLSSENAQKLEQMRSTVDEKLQATLEQRLGRSFKLVSDRLEMVHKGLGEMQNIASGVGDLKKTLTNVKTRGVWGEVQLSAILEQILTPDQYLENVEVKKGSQERVEFAVKLPGKDEQGSTIWLPIDAKFPLTQYQVLLDAEERGEKIEVDKQLKLLESNIKKEAKAINAKYIKPPSTTDFAIMFLPIEGLYATALKNSGLIESLQREYKVIITSPTTLSAILTSLKMGFKTLAIEKRSSQVWRLLDKVKSDFVAFGDILGKTKVKLDQASRAIGEAERKSGVITRRLENAEKLPAEKD